MIEFPGTQNIPFSTTPKIGVKLRIAINARDVVKIYNVREIVPNLTYLGT